MREIKFRAWDGQRMWHLLDGHAYSFKIYSDGSGRFGNEGGEDDLIFYRGENSEVKVMQYTGLKDKNGVEIYEGDIYTVWSNLNNENVGSYVVVWTRAGFGPIANERWLEVIGNIYENPELLEAKS